MSSSVSRPYITGQLSSAHGLTSDINPTCKAGMGIFTKQNEYMLSYIPYIFKSL